MDERKQALQYLTFLVDRMQRTNREQGRGLTDLKETKKYRPKFVSQSEFSSKSAKRIDLYETNIDNTTIFQILKLAIDLVRTSSYIQLACRDDCLKLTAMQTGKGEYGITLRQIDMGDKLQAVIYTISNRAE